MPFNKAKKYNDFLDLLSYNEKQRIKSLFEIYERDIFKNKQLKFKNKEVRPTQMNSDEATKKELFQHLTHKASYSEDGIKTRDLFDMDRSVRLHWIKYHLDGINVCKDLAIFTYVDRVRNRDVERVYIYDIKEKYVIVLEPKRMDDSHYFLLTAYYLNEKQGLKQINQKMKKATNFL